MRAETALVQKSRVWTMARLYFIYRATWPCYSIFSEEQTLTSETGTRAIGIAGACLVGSGRFLLHVPTHCTGSNVYVHESARGARDVARLMSGVSGLVSRARRCRRQG